MTELHATGEGEVAEVLLLLPPPSLVLSRTIYMMALSTFPPSL